MTPHAVGLVQESWARLAGREARLAAVFYARLFALGPELRRLFIDTDARALRGKLTAMLDLFVRTLDRPDDFATELAASARRHELYGVGPQAYRIGGEALLWALARELGPAFTGEVQGAWAEAYTLLADRMAREGNRTRSGG